MEKTLARISKSYQNDMVEFLQSLLKINSYTLNHPEVDVITEAMEDRISALGFRVAKHTAEGHACCLEAYNGKQAQILLIGHTDMAQSLTGNEAHSIVDGRIVCPGAGDMKGGLVTLYFALMILKDLDALFPNIRIVLSSDEEQGSPFSKKYILDAARKAKLCLSLEPARANGAVVTARKGGTYFTLTVKGRSAHSGVEPEKGISATEELANKVIELHRLSKPEEGITVNVGYLNAGTTLGNAIAGTGLAKIDVKYWTPEQGETTVDRIREICSVSAVPGTVLSLQQHPGFQPMLDSPRTRWLLDLIVQSGKKLGITIDSVKTGGEGDAGFCTSAGIPAICGMGPIAGYLHSPEEYLETNSLSERSALLAASLITINKELNGRE